MSIRGVVVGAGVGGQGDDDAGGGGGDGGPAGGLLDGGAVEDLDVERGVDLGHALRVGGKGRAYYRFLTGGHGNRHEPDCARARLASDYFSDAINCSHAWAGSASVTPSRSVVSRTMIAPALLAVSTQEPP